MKLSRDSRRYSVIRNSMNSNNQHGYRDVLRGIEKDISHARQVDGFGTGGCWQSESERVIYIQREGETRLGTPKYTASAFAVVCFRFPLHTIFILRGFAPVVTVGHPRFHVARGQLPESIFSSIDTATRTSYNHEARYIRVSIFSP